MKADQFTMFRLSKPWGYYPPEVESTIGKYEKMLQELGDKYTEEKRTTMALVSKLKERESELRRLHLELNSMELPEASEAVESMVLNEFKNYNNRVEEIKPTALRKKYEVNIPPIQIAEERSDIKSNTEESLNSSIIKDENDDEMFKIVT